MKHRNNKIVVLLSGGLDSSTLAYLVTRSEKQSAPYKKNRVFTLTFDYGQRHRKEIASSRKISRKINAAEHKEIKFDLRLWGGSALTENNIKIPLNRDLTTKSIPVTYVPARNTVFLSLALSYAEAIGAGEIYIGVNSVDYSGYVDCRPVFIKRFQELAKVATVCGVSGKPIKIKTPLMSLTKSEIIKLGQRLDVDWKNTWSCYFGTKLSCGLCDSCQLRLRGFMQAGIKDPLQYKQYPEFYKKWLQCHPER